MKLLIVGGSDAGISAAMRAMELDPEGKITVMLADSYPNYSICGLPFYLSDETPDWRSLAHRTEFGGIELLTNHTAEQIDTARHEVTGRTATGEEKTLCYDRLLLATGAEPQRPRIEGIDLPGVFPLHTVKDSLRVQEYLSNHHPLHAVIIGAGYIGLEMADSLTHRGLKVTLAGRSQTVLPTVDGQLGKLVEDELRRYGVVVADDVEVDTIKTRGSSLTVRGTGSFEVTAEVVLVAAGVKPASELARGAGIALGVRDAIKVSRRMETSAPDVYAAGDCVETWHRLLCRNTYLPLGTTAHKQGRVAGENIVGGSREFQGTLGTQVVKVFDLAIARTGLRDAEARDAGFDPATVGSTFPDHKAYYPGAHELHLRVTGDRTTKRLLGAQILGHWQAEVAKRVDVFSAAIFHEMNVEDLSDLDLSYTPPVSSPWDPVQMATQAWSLSGASKRESDVERG
ncbi:MAG: FAD-dependent oxidoreductase [Candidatus Eremiobacteraeota bacterium]|nr:FAD-dependent oxidoreductase [Candidatus Eremiobacteraeota bacterium]